MSFCRNMRKSTVVALFCLLLAVSCIAHFAAFNLHREPHNVFDELLNATMDAYITKAAGPLERLLLDNDYKDFDLKATIKLNPFKTTTLYGSIGFITNNQDAEHSNHWLSDSEIMGFSYSPSSLTEAKEYPLCSIRVTPLSVDELSIGVDANGGGAFAFVWLLYDRNSKTLTLQERSVGIEEYRTAIDCLERTFLADYFVHASKRKPYYENVDTSSRFSLDNLGDYVVDLKNIEKS